MDIDYNLKSDIEEIVKYTINPKTMNDDDIIGIIEDLIGKYHNLEEEHERLKKDLEDNYKPLTPSELYGVSDKDFI